MCRTPTSRSPFSQFHSHYVVLVNALLLGSLFKEDVYNYNFKWIKIVFSLLVPSYFSIIKTQRLCINNLTVFAYMLLMGASLKQKMPCIMHISIFGAFSVEKKSACALLYTAYSNNSSKVLSAMQLLHCKVMKYPYRLKTKYQNTWITYLPVCHCTFIQKSVSFEILIVKCFIAPCNFYIVK